MREFGAARAHRCDFAAAFFVVSFARAFKFQWFHLLLWFQVSSRVSRSFSWLGLS